MYPRREQDPISSVQTRRVGSWMLFAATVMKHCTRWQSQPAFDPRSCTAYAGRISTSKLGDPPLTRSCRKRDGEKVSKSPDFLGPPKTDKSRRAIDFPALGREVMQKERRRLMESRVLASSGWEDNGLVFPSEVGTPLEERNVLRRFQAICEANEFPKLRIYDLRHSHASLLIHEGVHPKKISERLGHASIKLTMDTYGHLFEGSDRDSAEKMEKLFAPKSIEANRSRPRSQSAPNDAPEGFLIGAGNRPALARPTTALNIVLTKLLTKTRKPARCGLLSD